MQNIMVFRFANSIFEQTWNNKFIDNVQITVAEKLGVETRGGYYESAGAARDMFQNHILQVLSLVAMEPPKSITAEDIRDQKVKILKALKAPEQDNVVIGQYGAGEIDSTSVVGYRNEPKVAPESETETFIAAKINIETPRWEGVPFYVRTGKRLKRRYSDVNIILKDVSCQLFCDKEQYYGPNVISIRIQPDEGIAITFNSKFPGSEIQLRPVAMDFCQKCLFEINTPEAYETLLYQIISGDQTLFPRWDGIEQSWRFMEPVLEIIKNKAKGFPNYDSGSFGPAAADELVKKDGREWLLPKEKLHIKI
ncbi:MAG: glucose-6-phosphate dehydrogenase (NADP(+)) [Planctomycetota bacterium]